MAARRRLARETANSDSVWRPVIGAVLFFFLASYYLKGDLTWGQPTRWTNSRYVQFRLFGKMRNFTETELAQYSGKDPALPIFLAIDGDVFDVSARPETYGPLGAYHRFAGRDAARAFGTGCFDTDLTHDLRELDQGVLDAIAGWKRFFKDNHKYWQVGWVSHSQLPEKPPAPCQGRQKPV